jgi:hypothetical protein
MMADMIRRIDPGATWLGSMCLGAVEPEWENERSVPRKRCVED